MTVMDMTEKKDPRINMVVTDEWLERLDLWRAKQGYPIPNRSEALRRIAEDRFNIDLEVE